MMEASKFVINTREGEKATFSIEAEEFTVRVLRAGNDCTVIDDYAGRMYMVKAEDELKAVKSYIDWALGMVKVWAADPYEFGCFEETDEECWASETCDIRKINESYDVIVER